MISLWPWMTVAAMGALHGLNPATGWALGAWHGLGAWRGLGDGGPRLLRMLMPVAIGHVASICIVAAAVLAMLRFGVEFRPVTAQVVAAALLLLMAVRHLRDGHTYTPHAWRGQAGIALWSFIVGTAHGAGWMIVPALAPLCASDMPAREITASGSLLMALAALGLHMTAMLTTTAAMAAGAQRCVRAVCGSLKESRASRPRGDSALSGACPVETERH